MAERMLSQAVSPNGAGANLPLCEELKIHVFKEEEFSKLSMIMPVTQCLNDDFYAKKPTPVFHISREILREYYIGWIIKKKSIWRNVLNGHILKYQQVCILIKILYTTLYQRIIAGRTSHKSKENTT